MDAETLFTEVEDIMCDQVILSGVGVDFKTESSIKITTTKFRLAVTLFVKSVLPAVVGVYYTYIRSKTIVFENVGRQVLPTMVAFVANGMSRSLAYVHQKITYRLIFAQIDEESHAATQEMIDDLPEKCVECLILSQPEDDVKVDVIFVHGLHGGLSKTWRQGTWRHERHKLRHESLKRGLKILEERRKKRAKRCEQNEAVFEDDFFEINNAEKVETTSTSDYSWCWPQDWIPRDCPGTRVIALNYTTDPYLWRPLWVKKRNRTSMTERSKEMIEELLKYDVGRHPIVWVGHSKGGLFVKQMLIDSFEGNTNLRGVEYLYSQTKGIMFYSVPHKGSILADVTMPFVKRSVELIEIERNCRFVLELHNKFLKMFEDKLFNPDVVSFIETSFTLMSVFFLKIVTCDSADPNVGVKIGVPLDHREICKPAGRDCFLYLELVKLIENIFSKTNL